MFSEIVDLLNGEHYLALLLILILSCILLGRNVLSSRVDQQGFWVTVLACTLLIVQVVFENYAKADPARRELRMAMCITGYTLRPMAVLGFLLVVWPRHIRRWYLWIPVVLNFLVYLSALFTPLAFSFDEQYRFVRGPLNWFMFAVCIGYLVLILVTMHKRFTFRRGGDFMVIYLCAAGCLGAMAVDIALGGITIVSAVLISCMAFYLFLRSQETDQDPLTRLWNRMVFYEDCKKQKNALSAVASIDMNGLKKTNDDLGHAAGDRALKMVGNALRSVMNRKVSAYRIGGDEFMILFLHSSEEEIQQSVVAFLEEVRRVGLSVAIGVSSKAEGFDTLEEMIRNSDRRMYEDKRRYYITHDRRKRQS